MRSEHREASSGKGEPPTQDSGSAQGKDDLAVRLSELARDLQQQDGPEQTMVSIVSAAITAIPGVDEASISVVIGRRRAESHAASGELPRKIDALQSQLEQGPCLDAVYEEQTVRVPDMRTEQRWPEFSKRAYEAGAGSMLSFQLYVEKDNLGALNLFAHEPHTFDDESEHVGLLFAAHAAVAFAGAQKQQQLRIGMSSRDTIGQAKGILMERHNINADQAFRVLVRASQDRNERLLHVAEQIVQSLPR